MEDVSEKKEAKVAKAPKPSKTVAKVPVAPVEVVKEEVTRERHNSAESAKEQRKSNIVTFKLCYKYYF